MHISELEELAGEGELEVSFKKVDGSPRSFACHCGAAKEFRNNVKGSKGKGATYDFKKAGVLPVWVDKAYNSNNKSGFRSVRLDSITSVTVNGQSYDVDKDGEMLES